MPSSAKAVSRCITVHLPVRQNVHPYHATLAPNSTKVSLPPPMHDIITNGEAVEGWKGKKKRRAGGA